MKLLTAGHSDNNSVWRQADCDFFTNEEYRGLIRENYIHLLIEGNKREIATKWSKTC